MTDKQRERIGMMLKRARKHSRLTQPDLAWICGLSTRVICKVECGKGAKLETIAVLARALGLSPRKVLGL